MGALLFVPSVVRAIPISGNAGLNGLGSFMGDFDYTATDDTSGVVTISLTNTSPALNGGFITGLVFNSPEVAVVTGVTLDSPDFPFLLLGGSSFSNSEPGNPFGDFDIGAALGGSWLGGGSPNAGIGVGSTGTFTFQLVGTGLGVPLGPGNFLETLSSDPGGGGAQALVVRFKGFENGGSDKVPGVVDVSVESVPEPGTALLLSLGLASLSARRFRSRSK